MASRPQQQSADANRNAGNNGNAIDANRGNGGPGRANDNQQNGNNNNNNNNNAQATAAQEKAQQTTIVESRIVQSTSTSVVLSTSVATRTSTATLNIQATFTQLATSIERSTSVFSSISTSILSSTTLITRQQQQQQNTILVENPATTASTTSTTTTAAAVTSQANQGNDNDNDDQGGNNNSNNNSSNNQQSTIARSTSLAATQTAIASPAITSSAEPASISQRPDATTASSFQQAANDNPPTAVFSIATASDTSLIGGPSAIAPPQGNSASSDRGMAIGAGIGAFLATFLGIAAIYFLFRRWRRSRRNSSGEETAWNMFSRASMFPRASIFHPFAPRPRAPSPTGSLKLTIGKPSMEQVRDQRPDSQTPSLLPIQRVQDQHLPPVPENPFADSNNSRKMLTKLPRVDEDPFKDQPQQPWVQPEAI